VIQAKGLSFVVRSRHSWPQSEGQTVAPLPMTLRRRVTPIGQQALQAAWGLPNETEARFVLSSRHGEFNRTFSLLQSLVAKEELSPADFSLSVHHALTGLLSIALHNRRGHIAVAAGPESFCFGLMEAACCLRENPYEPVIFIHMEDKLPDIYAPFSESYESPVTCAFALTAEGTSGDAKISMTSEPAIDNAPSRSHAMDFISFLQEKSTMKRSRGEYNDWRWIRHA
jgi:Beta-ketoacyl synthase, N-terminal domain